MMNKLIVAGLAGLLLASGSNAELVATPLSGDSRLVQFNYDEDNTFLILSKPKAVTHIAFAADEMVQSIAAGDTAQWELTPTKSRKNMFIKPRYEGLETSMTIITDKRTYQFVLRSTGDGKKWYQRVSWLYAGTTVLEQDVKLDSLAADAGFNAGGRRMANDQELIRPAVSSSDAPSTAGLRPDKLRFGYEINGNAPFKPVNVFDDGRFTYLKMPADVQELPALFTVIEGQNYSLVNYTIDGDYMVAQRLLTEAVLKLGKSEIRIVKQPPKKSWFGSREVD